MPPDPELSPPPQPDTDRAMAAIAAPRFNVILPHFAFLFCHKSQHLAMIDGFTRPYSLFLGKAAFGKPLWECALPKWIMRDERVATVGHSVHGLPARPRPFEQQYRWGDSTCRMRRLASARSFVRSEKDHSRCPIMGAQTLRNTHAEIVHTALARTVEIGADYKRVPCATFVADACR